MIADLSYQEVLRTIGAVLERNGLLVRVDEPVVEGGVKQHSGDHVAASRKSRRLSRLIAA